MKKLLLSIALISTSFAAFSAVTPAAKPSTVEFFAKIKKAGSQTKDQRLTALETDLKTFNEQLKLLNEEDTSNATDQLVARLNEYKEEAQSLLKAFATKDTWFYHNTSSESRRIIVALTLIGKTKADLLNVNKLGRVTRSAWNSVRYNKATVIKATAGLIAVYYTGKLARYALGV